MNIEDQVTQVEADFYHKNAYDPTYLILSPQAYEELKMVIAEQEGLDPGEAFFKVLPTYEGLKVAVTPINMSEDVLVC